jgi:ribonuclease BN (tRNA processing enzyme)
MKQPIQIHFLGTNGWYTTETGHTSCHLIDAPSCYIILDAGEGIYRAGLLIKENKPIFLFLSHLHLDHINGLHVLNQFRFEQGLTLCFSNEGLKELIQIVRQPYTVAFKDLKITVEFSEIKLGDNSGFPFGLRAEELVHSSKCFGYRFEIDNKIIAYCTDTGICPVVFQLAKDADLLISECALKPGQESPDWPHLNPTDAAKVGKEAKVKRLALVHFDAENYPTIQHRIKAEKEAKKVFDRTFAAIDNQIIEI